MRARRRTARPDKRGAGAPEPFFFLPGGTLRTDEDAARCARREWEEEAGLPCGPLRPAAVVENFFGPPEKRRTKSAFISVWRSCPPLCRTARSASSTMPTPASSGWR
ncbi:NUDIX domain-containing protein [Deinococcus wulumuqiensis]|uniref:NUDIX domain-containing protein n=1 Tax=Deinococcus wulumuqiensis TaxID=980427 RepID=UPI001E33D614|nr:NUDIX hydrolase [Deinococcus wulumuqiensis]